jgi:excisionase family DNA binding protein
MYEGSMNEKFLTTEEVSRMLHVGKSTVKRWSDEGKLKCFRTPGGHRKFRFSSVQEFIEMYQYNVSLIGFSQISNENYSQIKI